jgi:hypothetical protein
MNQRAGSVHAIREKRSMCFKASHPVGERFGEGSKSLLQKEKSGFINIYFFL